MMRVRMVLMMLLGDFVGFGCVAWKVESPSLVQGVRLWRQDILLAKRLRITGWRFVRLYIAHGATHCGQEFASLTVSISTIFSLQSFGSTSVACGYQFNTIDYSSEYDPYTAFDSQGPLYVNCADLAFNEYKCVKHSCKNLLSEEHALRLRDCFYSKTNKPIKFTLAGSYRYLPKCSQIDLFPEPGQSSSIKWCPRDYVKHLNTDIYTCEECSFNRTIKRPAEICHQQDGKSG
ncbi:hypothetical protein O181_049991 [Austropuccinia psidii MF-1]|uniref:Uncharacterized protein n=1 Tax=Austropuccinia psidii MF-1 TaxID=1389203 RepID=A0A9Q3E0Z8_9BASI|nr:hypothetical protein [Austropuccinia psidii MF-1]